MHHRPLVFLDIETTGGSAANSRVLEVGAIRVESDAITATYSQLLSPAEPIPSFISQLTGITEPMVADAPEFRAIVPELDALFTDAIFVAHNVAFDYSFIKMEYAKLGRTFAMDRLCTVRLSRALYPQQARHNLDTVIRSHGLEVTNRHRALDDAKVLYEFYKIAQAQHGLQTYAAMNRLLTKAR